MCGNKNFATHKTRYVIRSDFSPRAYGINPPAAPCFSTLRSALTTAKWQTCAILPMPTVSRQCTKGTSKPSSTMADCKENLIVLRRASSLQPVNGQPRDVQDAEYEIARSSVYYAATFVEKDPECYSTVVAATCCSEDLGFGNDALNSLQPASGVQSLLSLTELRSHCLPTWRLNDVERASPEWRWMNPISHCSSWYTHCSAAAGPKSSACRQSVFGARLWPSGDLRAVQGDQHCLHSIDRLVPMGCLSFDICIVLNLSDDDLTAGILVKHAGTGRLGLPSSIIEAWIHIGLAVLGNNRILLQASFPEPDHYKRVRVEILDLARIPKVSLPTWAPTLPLNRRYVAQSRVQRLPILLAPIRFLLFYAVLRRPEAPVKYF